jgi:hypothetical protein
MLKFETNDKYYVVELNIDLLGDLVVVCYYGSRHTKHSHTKTYCVEDHNHAQKLIDQITRTRIRHGYDLIEM